MNEHIKLLIADIKGLWEKLDLNQKFFIGVLIVAAIVISVFFIAKATEPNWTVLYSDLSKEDVASITESFKKSGYAYKLSDDKTAILVKNQDKEDLKMYVAENDLIKDTSGGFELLDNLQLGSTDFKNKLTKQRIFQGELTRSIEKINGVSKARVQLAEPERSIFSDEDENPTASVVLILNPGVKLKASQILAIKNLVAYSVPRLTNDKVFITDQFGNVLSEDVSKNSTDMQSYRTAFEKEAAKKIQDTLETIMGKDNVSVQVTTTMDFNQTRATIESYTPNKEANSGVIVSQQGEKETYSNPQNIASDNKKEETTTTSTPQDEQAALQVKQDPNVAAAPLNETPNKTNNFDADEKTKYQNDDVRKLSYEKEKSATQYAVTKEVKQVVYAPGSVTKMSVAVAVNKILTDAEKKEIENLVIAASGLDLARGDIVNVTSLKFTGIDTAAEIKEDKERQKEFTMEVLSFIFKNVSPVIIILLLGIFALHNFKNLFKPMANENSENEEESDEDIDNKIASFDPYLALQRNQVEDPNYDPDEVELVSAVDKKKNEIINIVLGNPEEASRVLLSYIKE